MKESILERLIISEDGHQLQKLFINYGTIKK